MIYLLEIFRGLAALWVFSFHAKDIFKTTSPAIYHFTEYGYLAIPIFFVISGYVITYSAQSSMKADRPALAFLKKRLLRVYPTFWASIIVVSVAPYLIAAISMLKTGSYEMPVTLVTQYSASEWFHFLTLTKVFFTETPDLQAQFNVVNAVYWTLAIEMQFYLFVFACMLLKKYYGLLMILMTVLSLMNHLYPVGLNYGLFIYYWPMFAVGIGLAYLHRNGLHMDEARLSRPVRVSVLIMATFAALTLVLSSRYEHIDELVFALMFAALLWGMAPVEKGLARIKKGGNVLARWTLELFVLIGTMSYSLYMLHDRVYEIPAMFLRQLLGDDNVAYGVLTIFCTVALCLPFYLLVERKFMSKNYTKIHKKVLQGADSGKDETPPAVPAPHDTVAQSG